MLVARVRFLWHFVIFLIFFVKIYIRDFGTDTVFISIEPMTFVLIGQNLMT